MKKLRSAVTNQSLSLIVGSSAFDVWILSFTAHPHLTQTTALSLISAPQCLQNIVLFFIRLVSAKLKFILIIFVCFIEIDVFNGRCRTDKGTSTAS